MGPWALNKSCSAGPILVRSTFKIELNPKFLGPGRKIRRGRSLTKFLAGIPPKLSDISKFGLRKDPWALNKSCSAGPILVRSTFSGHLGLHFWVQNRRNRDWTGPKQIFGWEFDFELKISKFRLRMGPWALNKSCSAGPILVRSTFKIELNPKFLGPGRKIRWGRSLTKFLAGIPHKLSDISKFGLRMDPWALNKSCSAGPNYGRTTFLFELGQIFLGPGRKIRRGRSLAKI